MGWFVLLFLISLLCLFIGLIKPTVFARLLGAKVTRKKIGLVFGGATLVLFFVIGANGPKSPTIKQQSPDLQKEKAPSTIPVITKLPVITASPVITPRVQEQRLEPLKLKGVGPKATDFFKLDKGLRRFTITNSGTGYFGVVLMDDKGDKIDRLVNDMSPYNGSKALKISKTGNYLLNIESNGDWTVTIE